jgi:hypothetical protein
MLEKRDNTKCRIIVQSNINKLNYKLLPSFIHKILENFSCIFTYHLQMLEPFGNAKKYKKILFTQYSILIAPVFENISDIFSNNKIKF